MSGAQGKRPVSWTATAVASLLSPATCAYAADAPFLPPYGDTGCWVSIFDEKHFRGQSARLTGPTFIEKFERDGLIVEPDLRNVGGQDFSGASIASSWP